MDQRTQAKVQKLNASWRHYLSRAMGMDDGAFKLAQGSLGLQTADSSGLFSMADAVPPATSLFDAGATLTFSSSYTSLLGALLPQSGTDLPGVLGEDYNHWISYRNAYFQLNPASSQTQEQVFERFANQRLDPRRAQKAVAIFNSAAHTPWSLAFDTNIAPANCQVFTDSSGQMQTLKRYTPTLDAAQAELNRGARLEIDYDSELVAASLDESQVTAAASGFYDLFCGGAWGAFDQLSTKAAASGFSITGYINKYKTVAVQRGGWFTAEEHARAHDAKDDDTIWDPRGNSGKWDSFFAQPNGCLARRVTELLLVTDYELTVTSQATYSQEDYDKILSQASFGIWPFFSATGSCSHTADSKLNSSSHLETTFTLESGRIQIWGVNVLNTRA